MSDIKDLLNKLADAFENKTIKIELHHYHHYDNKNAPKKETPLPQVPKEQSPKVPKKTLPKQEPLMTAEELADVMDDLNGGFDMSSYIEKKRAECVKVSKRDNNLTEPEPPKITPLLRYTKKEQQKIQKNIFNESKDFIMECYPDKNSDELEDLILEEANKRLDAWSNSHYKK